MSTCSVAERLENGNPDSHASAQWERLLDVDRVRGTLIDLGAFLVAYAIFEGYLIGKPREFLSLSGETREFGSLEHRLVNGDLSSQRGEVRKAAIEWHVKMNALDPGDVGTFEAVRALRNRVAHESFDPLVHDLRDELFNAVVRLDELFEKLDRWWILEVEASIQPELFERDPYEPEPEVKSMARVVMQYVLGLAEESTTTDPS